MSEGEYKISDQRGRFAQVVREGRRLNDVSWTTGRILLSNKRLVLAGSEGKRTVPLTKIQSLEGRFDVNQLVAKVSGYVSLRIDDQVILVAPQDNETFEENLYGALLNHQVVTVRHPAVEGGVVQDTEWEQAQLKVEEDAVNVAISTGTFVSIELDDIGGIETNERTVNDEKRRVVEVEHAEEGTSVQTYLSGSGRLISILASLLRKGEQRSETGAELSKSEREVLIALYSGVSPFEIPEFLGMDVDDVEEIYERLVELDVLEEVRVRREVALKARGRNIASEAMNNQ